MKPTLIVILCAISSGFIAASCQALEQPATSDPVFASWYGKRHAGRPTASGERFDPKALTAAHPSLPLGSLVEVRRWTDGRRVIVRINDRGPARGNGIDLSEAAARALGIVAEGAALVVVTPMTQLAEGR